MDVAGLRPPFLLRATPSAGGPLYSVGTQAGVANIHPFTDLIIGSWYKVQGKSTAQAFDDPAHNAPPNASEVSVISAVVKDLVGKWLHDFIGDNSTDSDLISTPFRADGQGFDKVLDASSVDTGTGTVTIRDSRSAPTLTQVSTLTYDPARREVSVNTSTTAASGATTSSVTSSLVPTTSSLQAALAGVNSTFATLAQIVNSKGADLSDADLAGLYDTSYFEAGFGADYGAAGFAQYFRGAHLQSGRIERILSFDETAEVIEVEFTASYAMNGTNITTPGSGSSTGSGTFFRQQADGSWRFYGDQRPAAFLLLMEAGGQGSAFLTAAINVYAPVGVVGSASVTGGGLFFETRLNKTNQTLLESIAASPSRSIQVEHELFSAGVEVSTPPPAGTEFTVNVTPVSGPARSYKIVSTGATNETITITSPSGYALADARLGADLNVSWTLPKTLAVSNLEFRGAVANTGFRCEVKPAGPRPGVDSTRGTIVLPAVCGGQPVTIAELGVVIYGPHGERTEFVHFFS